MHIFFQPTSLFNTLVMLILFVGGLGLMARALRSHAFAGELDRSAALATDLAQRYPENTLVNGNYVPSIRAEVALVHHDPPKAIEILQTTSAFELGLYGQSAFSPALYPVYIRGQAYLALRDGAKAAAEFQKIIDHPGIVLYQLIGALSHLQLGRAYALQGDAEKARSAYDDFFTLWKDADPDTPILKEAKAEYGKLQ